MSSDIKKNIEEIRSEYKKDVSSNLQNLDEIHIKYLGKKGLINQNFKLSSSLSPENKIEFSSKLNKLKKEIEEDLEFKREKSTKTEKVNLAIPVESLKSGNLHPLTLVRRDLYQFFHYYGFSVYDGPEIETDYYNFEMLGVPKDHPARELQDTLYIMEPETLLRTQTSSIESRILEGMEPPIRFVVGDRAFRNETESRTNLAFFHQFQGVYVDRHVTMGNLKWIFTKALKHVLGEDTVIRFRAKYYPEVEPGMSPDILCKFCLGAGCEVCKKRGWIEIAGGGMIHPSTLEAAGIDPKVYSGFAFGWGLDRIVMQRYKINDIRVLYGGQIIYE
jgi:phenylalanyl-tRNA synthetase alpha chain